jgi:hypothetical protein
MMDPRPFGTIVALIGAVGLIISALADPIGVGQAEGFGWLQILGCILGGVVILLGLAMAAEWMPYPGRPVDTTADARQNTTVVRD